MRRRIVFVLAAAVASAFCWLKSVEIMPARAAWSGWVPEEGYVAQSFICNYDSVCYCELFVGYLGANPSNTYDADIFEYPGGVNAVAYAHDAPAEKDHDWLRFNFTTVSGQKFVRGKEYLVKFTRPGDSIHFYVDQRDRYPYGHAVWSGGEGQPPPQPADDLCLRILGKAYVDGIFSTQSVIAHQGTEDKANWERCIERQAEVGVRSDKIGYGHWYWIQPHASNEWVWGWEDTLMELFANEGVRTTMAFRGTPGWATCAVEKDSGNPWHPHGGAIPKNLYLPVKCGDAINPDNYYAKYIYEFVKRYGPIGTSFDGEDAGTFWLDHWGTTPYQPMVLYEGFAEGPLRALGDPPLFNTRGFWRLDTCVNYPRESLTDPVYRDTLAHHIELAGNVLEGRRSSFASVYSRLFIVVDSAVKLACANPGQDSERVRTAAYVSDDYCYRGKGDDLQDWLGRLEEHEADEFFDVGSYFSYADWRSNVGSPEFHRDKLRELRREFDRAGYAPRSFWSTEFGTSYSEDDTWPETTRASLLLRSYALMQSENARQGYPVEQCNWFTFTDRYNMNWGITDASVQFNLLASAYAYKQWSGLTRGASYEGQVLPFTRPWDTAYIGTFQFEDSAGGKFWVGWNTEDFIRRGIRESLAVPSRTDDLDTFRTAIDTSQHQGTVATDDNGYYTLELDTIPKIFVEKGTPERPDLVVDSFRVTPAQPQVGKPMGLVAYVTNIGNRATPDSVWYRFLCDGVPFCSIPEASLDTNATDTLVIIGYTVPAWMRGDRIFRIEANPGQIFVEKDGLDDNGGFSRNKVVLPPGGHLTADLADGHSNVPLVLLRLTSHSWEADSTGNTPCDSASLVQWWYGFGDTAVQDADTSAWFAFGPDTLLDTCWQFLFGEGEYRFYLIVKDSWGESGLIADSATPVAVFDSGPPTGSILVNSGARFATACSCTVAMSVSDSLAGVYRMRLGNQALENLVGNSGFDPEDGCWEFSEGGQYDDGLEMAVLEVEPGEECWVRQEIAAKNVLAHVGDTVRLGADILVQTAGAEIESLGLLRFSYRYENEDPEKQDSFWVAGEEWFGAGVAAHVGLENLECEFSLPSPEAESGWTFAGGRVEIRTPETEDSIQGSVWLDNVNLEPSGPEPEYSWWQAKDTLKTWELPAQDGWQSAYASFQDSAGVENWLPLVDSIILDLTPPLASIVEPDNEYLVGGIVSITGWAYDPEIGADTFFYYRRLSYRHVDSTEWLPVLPDSVSFEPAYPVMFTPTETIPTQLGYWNTEGLEDNEYWLRLAAQDSAGNETRDSVWVVVNNGGEGEGEGSGPEGGGSGMGEGSVYVGSQTGVVLHLSEELDSLDAFLVSDSTGPAFITALLALSPDSMIVADARARRIIKRSRQGGNQRSIVTSLGYPSGLCQDGASNLWLSDRGMSRVAKFRSDGSLVLVRGGPDGDSVARLKNPEAIAVRGHRVYVADTRNNRIAVWDTAGNYLRSIEGDFGSPAALALSRSGTYVLDKTAGTVKGLNSIGGQYYTIQGAAPFRCLCLSQDGKSLFTLGPSTNKVLKYRIRSADSLPKGGAQAGAVRLPSRFVLYQPYPNPSRQRLLVRYGVPKTTRVSVRIFDICGRQTRTLVDAEQKPGYYDVVWDRTDDRKMPAPAGVYFCQLRTEGFRDVKKVVVSR